MGKVIGLVGLLVVIGVGVYFWSNQSKEALQSGADSAMEKAQEAKNLVEEGQAITSLSAAMALGRKTTCTHTTDVNGQKYTTSVTVEGKKYQATTTMGDTTTYVANDGNMQYMWNSKDKQGYKMELSCLEKMKDSLKDMPQAQQMQQDVESDFEKATDVTCKPGGDVNLTIPTDVSFTDQCAMMEQSMQMMKNIPQGMTPPAGY
jgi:hypothetical protein